MFGEAVEARICAIDPIILHYHLLLHVAKFETSNISLLVLIFCIVIFSYVLCLLVYYSAGQL